LDFTARAEAQIDAALAEHPAPGALPAVRSLDDGWYIELSRGSWPQNVKDLLPEAERSLTDWAFRLSGRLCHRPEHIGDNGRR
jgi:hypothetical protein